MRGESFGYNRIYRRYHPNTRTPPLIVNTYNVAFLSNLFRNKFELIIRLRNVLSTIQRHLCGGLTNNSYTDNSQDVINHLQLLSDRMT